MRTCFSTGNAAVLLFVCAGLAGCGAGAAAQPTATATGTPTLSPTATVRRRATEIYVKNPPTKTPYATKALAPTRQPAKTCGSFRDGSWASKEHILQSWMTTPWSIVWFKTAGCEIYELQIFADPATGKEFGATFSDLHEPIRDGEFSFTLSNPDGPGSVSVYGKFTTDTQCQGFMMFSEGFQVGDYVLPSKVTIGYTAEG